jgi:hypothetical protein
MKVMRAKGRAALDEFEQAPALMRRAGETTAPLAVRSRTPPGSYLRKLAPFWGRQKIAERSAADPSWVASCRAAGSPLSAVPQIAQAAQ